MNFNIFLGIIKLFYLLAVFTISIARIIILEIHIINLEIKYSFLRYIIEIIKIIFNTNKGGLI